MSKLHPWVIYRSAAYLCGRGLDFGATEDLIFRPEARQQGKYCIGVSPTRTAGAAVCDDNLGAFIDGGFDYVLLRRFIEAVPNLPRLMDEVVAKLRIGGHLIVNVPLNATADFILHSFDPDIIKVLVAAHGSWQLKADIIRDGQILQIYRKLSSRPGLVRPAVAKPEKSACIVRYGAFGDMIMITPLIKKLKADGYHVTVNCTGYSKSVLDGNPYIDNVIIQEKDVIYNPELSSYWKEWEGDYAKYINLSESIEGSLLVVEGRPEFYTPAAYRHLRGNKNYHDHTMALGGYPEMLGTRGELFFNHTERKWADQFLKKYRDKFVVVWSLNGSSYHKMYPLMGPVLDEWFKNKPDAVVITVGDELSRLHEFEHPQVVCMSGKANIREIMCLTEKVDLVIGPETAILNAASCFDTPKIVFLSHSTHENLCKYWVNHVCLEPDKSVAPCYPCHQLHYSRQSCPQGVIKDIITDKEIVAGPVCAMGAVSTDQVLQKLNDAYISRRNGII